MKAVLTFLGEPYADVHTLSASESNFRLSKKHSSKPAERKERRLARRGTRATVESSSYSPNNKEKKYTVVTEAHKEST